MLASLQSDTKASALCAAFFQIRFPVTLKKKKGCIERVAAVSEMRTVTIRNVLLNENFKRKQMHK